MTPVRWYNRLAAWLYEVIAYPLMDLAMPLWDAEAEAEIEEMWREEQDAERDAMLNSVHEDGYADGARDADNDSGVPF